MNTNAQRLLRIFSIGCAFSAAMISVGCGGDTNRKVFERYAPQFNERRQQFQKIAAALPPPGGVTQASRADLAPKPVYDAKNPASSNTEIVMYDQLLDPDVKSEGNERFDLLLAENLLTAMKWTGPKNPMTGSGLDTRNPNMEQNLKQALAERYVVVLRPVRYIAPVATDESTFKAGVADLEGFVADLQDQKVVASFRYSAQSGNAVEYQSKKGDSAAARQAQLEKFAYSSLYEDARKKLKPLLEQTTGGSFRLD